MEWFLPRTFGGMIELLPFSLCPGAGTERVPADVKLPFFHLKHSSSTEGWKVHSSG